MTKDYRIEIRVKNNWLLKMIEDRGYETVSDFCRKNGLQPSIVGVFVNLKETPIKEDGKWRGSFMRIADALRCLPEDICPPQHLREVLKKNKARIEVGIEELAHFLTATADNPTPIEHLLNEEGARTIETCFECLKPREERVLRLRYGLTPDGKEHTLKEVGEMLGVQRERVRQIEIKALRLMKYPSRSKFLREVAEAWGIHNNTWELPKRHYTPEWKKNEEKEQKS